MTSPKTKKVIIVSSSLLAVAIIVLVSFMVVQSQMGESSQSMTENTGEPENSTTDSVPAPVIEATLVLDEAIVNATVDPNNSIRYYRASDGNVFRTNTLGADPELLDDSDLTNLTSVEWSPSAPFVVTNVNNQFYTFNFAEQVASTFPAQVTDLQPMSDGRVFYVFRNENGTADLSIANADGSDWQTVITLSSDQVVLHPIPGTNTISQTLIPSAYRGSSLRIIDTTTGEATSVLEDKPGLNVSWSPTGDRGLATYTTERGGSTMTMSIVDAQGFELQSLAPEGTLAEKIVWTEDGSTAYFTKPKVGNTQILPDDYYSGSLTQFQESLYRVDIATGQVTMLSDSIGTVDSRDLMLNAAETEVLFINANDNKLYKVTLPE